MGNHSCDLFESVSPWQPQKTFRGKHLSSWYLTTKLFPILTCTHMQLHIHSTLTFPHAHSCTYTHMHAFIFPHMYVLMHTSTHMHALSIPTHMLVHTCTLICVPSCPHTHISVHTCTLTCRHIHFPHTRAHHTLTCVHTHIPIHAHIDADTRSPAHSLRLVGVLAPLALVYQEE